jgi:hypothetical protein
MLRSVSHPIGAFDFNRDLSFSKEPSPQFEKMNDDDQVLNLLSFFGLLLLISNYAHRGW